jgi:hypothetical protein
VDALESSMRLLAKSRAHREAKIATAIPMQLDQYKKRGGAREGAGRPKGKVILDKKESVTIRLSPEQRVKLAFLGGAKWVRAKIDEASA